MKIEFKIDFKICLNININKYKIYIFYQFMPNIYIINIYKGLPFGVISIITLRIKINIRSKK